ncbi:hypothetical protein AB9F45_39335, partial [Rhizobium leguminosarum]|uniref:hypothetical protein n=1 Tax=Rhizobium leguminosarum TaxID=384 RepID=UPI003F98620F
AAYATADNAKLTFLKDLIDSYIDARYYQERIALSQASLKSRQCLRVMANCRQGVFHIFDPVQHRLFPGEILGLGIGF